MGINASVVTLIRFLADLAGLFWHLFKSGYAAQNIYILWVAENEVNQRLQQTPRSRTRGRV
jgi:hypothetical protein